jgi:N-methylhydantoinase A
VRLAGPAIVNEMSATTLLLPGQTATVDAFGNIVVEIGR